MEELYYIALDLHKKLSHALVETRSSRDHIFKRMPLIVTFRLKPRKFPSKEIFKPSKQHI